MEGDARLAPGFPVPSNMDYQSYHKYIDEILPVESPVLYGLHPNAEIGFLTNQADTLFKLILELQPRDFSTSGIYGMSRDDKVKYDAASDVFIFLMRFKLKNIIGSTNY